MQDNTEFKRDLFNLLVKSGVDLTDAEGIGDTVCDKKALTPMQFKILRNLSPDTGELINIGNFLLSGENKDELTLFLRLLLDTKHFNAICTLFDKAFISHVGGFNYSSKNSQTFSMTEKAFDRFIEAAMFCEIDIEEYLPLLLCTLLSGSAHVLYKWKRPVIEYLTDFVRNNERKFIEYVKANFYEYGAVGFDFLLHFSDGDIFKELTGLYLQPEFEYKKDVLKLLLLNYSQSLEFLRTRFLKRNLVSCEVAELLLHFKREPEVCKFLENSYDKTEDGTLKRVIIENLRFSRGERIKTTAQFVKNNQKSITGAPKEYLGLSVAEYPQLFLNSGDKTAVVPVENVLYTYSQTCSPYEVSELKYFKKYITDESLKSLANFVFERITDTEAPEWAYSLIVQNSKVDDIAKFVQTLKSAGADDKLKTLVSVISKIRSGDIVDVALSPEIGKSKAGIIREFIRACECMGGLDVKNIELLKDMTVPGFGILNNTVEVSISGGEKAKLKLNEDMSFELISPEFIPEKRDIDKVQRLRQDVLKQISVQSKRMELAFDEQRTWTPAEFENIILKSPILSTLCSQLVWGKYKDGKLFSVFLIKDNKIEDIISVAGSLESSYVYGLFHPLEFPGHDFSDIVSALHPPFEQMGREVYPKSNFNTHLSAILRFNGLLVMANSFISRLIQQGWEYGIADFEGRFRYMTRTNYAAEITAVIEFLPLNKERRLDDATTLGELRFYRTGDTFNIDGRIINKVNALEIEAVDDRFLSNVIFEVATAGRK